jgi:hypothetical protein
MFGRALWAEEPEIDCVDGVVVDDQPLGRGWLQPDRRGPIIDPNCAVIASRRRVVAAVKTLNDCAKVGRWVGGDSAALHQCDRSDVGECGGRKSEEQQRP